MSIILALLLQIVSQATVPDVPQAKAAGVPQAKAPDDPADFQIYLKDNFWVVSRYKDTCLASSSYVTNDTELDIFWYARTDSVKVGIHDKRFASLKENEENSLKLVFRKGGKLDTGWGDVKTFGDVDSNGKPGFRFALNGTVALADFASSDLVGLFKDEKVVESLALNGSSKAVASLRLCGSDVITRHPVDPFEK